LRVFYVNFDFKLGHLSFFMNLTDRRGNDMKIVVSYSLLVEMSVHGGMLIMIES